jgi:hypothetical protein
MYEQFLEMLIDQDLKNYCSQVILHIHQEMILLKQLCDEKNL